jgi:hypothetical protein
VVERQLEEGREPAAVVEELYLRCLSRLPTEEETTRLVAEIAGVDNKRQALEDLFWALLNTKEFVFTH